MANYRAVAVKLHECQRLVDLSSIKRDFERCKDMCEKIIPSSINNGLDRTIIDALATAIPIIYSRPFLGGIRIRVVAILSEYSEDDLVLHEQILAMRSKFSAHSINCMEQETVRVWLNPEERGGKKINNVNAAADVLLALSENDYAHIIDLCNKSLTWLNNEFEAEASRLPQTILEHYTLDELYEMKDQWNRATGLEAVKKGRSRPNQSQHVNKGTHNLHNDEAS